MLKQGGQNTHCLPSESEAEYQHVCTCIYGIYMTEISRHFVWTIAGWVTRWICPVIACRVHKFLVKSDKK